MDDQTNVSPSFGVAVNHLGLDLLGKQNEDAVLRLLSVTNRSVPGELSRCGYMLINEELLTIVSRPRSSARLLRGDVRSPNLRVHHHGSIDGAGGEADFRHDVIVRRGGTVVETIWLASLILDQIIPSSLRETEGNPSSPSPIAPPVTIGPLSSIVPPVKFALS